MYSKLVSTFWQLFGHASENTPSAITTSEVDNRDPHSSYASSALATAICVTHSEPATLDTSSTQPSNDDHWRKDKKKWLQVSLWDKSMPCILWQLWQCKLPILLSCWQDSCWRFIETNSASAMSSHSEIKNIYKAARCTYHVNYCCNAFYGGSLAVILYRYSLSSPADVHCFMNWENLCSVQSVFCSVTFLYLWIAEFICHIVFLCAWICKNKGIYIFQHVHLQK